MKFALYTPAGVITSTGRCPDGMESMQALPGTSVYIGESGMHDSIDVATGALIHGVEPALTYVEQRRYPPIAEQLDALWHGMDAGEIPVSSRFYQMIKVVKDAHPRPEVVFDAYLMPEA